MLVNAYLISTGVRTTETLLQGRSGQWGCTKITSDSCRISFYLPAYRHHYSNKEVVCHKNPKPTDRLARWVYLARLRISTDILGLTCIFALSPVALSVLLLCVFLGLVDSPMLTFFKEISSQHQEQYKSMTILSRAIIDNLEEIKIPKVLSVRLLKAMIKTLKARSPTVLWRPMATRRR